MSRPYVVSPWGKTFAWLPKKTLYGTRVWLKDVYVQTCDPWLSNNQRPSISKEYLTEAELAFHVLSPANKKEGLHHPYFDSNKIPVPPPPRAGFFRIR